MIKPIIKDENFLSIKSSKCTNQDVYIARDLKDTLNFHKKECAGMAANMIGYSKNMIIVNAGYLDLILVNPKIIKKSNPYQTQEGCLSLMGQRNTIRYRQITVEYQDVNFKKHVQVFTDFTAQVIQHEIDHCNGILI
ncbi:MAG: peptide deformylase [Floccifex sp.]